MQTRFGTRPVAAALALAAFASLGAQQPAFKRTMLQKGDLSFGGREAITARADFGAGATSGRHTHPGEEVGYLLEGALRVEIDGKPVMRLKAGDTFFIPNGAIHNATTEGAAGAAVVSTYIVEKGKPLATPAP
jgi:quercetin dioxygenase-like cupin family protein